MSVPVCPSPDKSIEWEYLWASYDAPTYKLVLDQLSSNEIIYDTDAIIHEVIDCPNCKSSKSLNLKIDAELSL